MRKGENMMTKILKVMKNRLFLKLRYSTFFQLLHHLFSYSPKEQILELAMQFVSSCELDGDYLEFGVYEGNTFIIAFYLS